MAVEFKRVFRQAKICSIAHTSGNPCSSMNSCVHCCSGTDFFFFFLLIMATGASLLMDSLPSW